jgi:hypothetical protein
MDASIAAWLTGMRDWAAQPDAQIFTVQGKRGSIAIFPDDVNGKTDDELLALVRERCNE